MSDDGPSEGEAFLSRGPFREPTPEEVAKSVANFCFTFGFPDPDTGVLPSPPPTDAEKELRTYCVDESIPEAWREQARTKVAELLRQRRIRAGLESE